MHYYKRNIGDYAKKAGKLSMLEHGAYTLLIDACYDREKFPTESEAIEWCWARNEEEIAAVKFVLARFFTVEDDRYVQSRIAEEIDRYHRNAQINSRIATEREAKRTNRANTVHEPNTVEHEPPPNHKPLTNTITDTDVSVVGNDVADQCPHKEIIALYCELIPVGIVPKVWNGTRAASLKARWREDKKRQSLDYWRRFFSYIAQSPFLTGKVSGANNRPFEISLDWIVKAENFNKIIEGKYHSRDAG